MTSGEISGTPTAVYTAVRVKNLDPNTTDAENLQQAFATYGRVKSAVLVKGQGGQNTGAAYIYFEDVMSAKAAVERMNGADLNGSKVEVQPAHDAPISADKPSLRSCSIFVKGFGPEVGTEALKEAFQDAGEIVSAVVMRDQTGTSRGFGFVNFEKPEDADKAIANFNDEPHTQGTWLVRKALPKTPKQEALGHDPCTLYVRGLEASVDRDRLAAMFQAFGPIVSCRILTDPKTSISRCAGLMRFETPEQAMRAIRDMHGRQVGERRLHVTIAQDGPRFQKSAPRDFDQPRTPHGLSGMMNAYTPTFPMGVPHRFPVQMSGPMFHGGSPEQAHVMHAAQQGNMHPSYAMYNARMMYMSPQGQPQPMWPPGFHPGSPFSGSALSDYGALQQYQQQQAMQGLYRHQQAQHYYMMTSGQDGSYFDVASNSFVDNSRGYRGGPIPAPPRRARRGTRDGSKKTLASGLTDSGPTGSLQEVAEGESSAESSLAQGEQSTMPRPGARSLSDGQLDGLMGQLASMNNDKMRKDLLGGHVFALIEEEQSEQLAAEIASILLNMSEGEILHMLRSREALDTQVARVLHDMREPAGGSPRSSGHRSASPAAQQAAQNPSPSPEAFGRLSIA